jgi:predicted RNase H-like nuclease (RuvC/YqgF family)
MKISIMKKRIEEQFKMIEELKKENEELKKQISELTPAPTPRKVDNPVEEIEEEPKKKKYKCECGAVLGQDDKWYIDNHKKRSKAHLKWVEANNKK